MVDLLHELEARRDELASRLSTVRAPVVLPENRDTAVLAMRASIRRSFLAQGTTVPEMAAVPLAISTPSSNGPGTGAKAHGPEHLCLEWLSRQLRGRQLNLRS